MWNTFAPNYQISLTASEPALAVCKEEGVGDVFVTLWGDDGYESNVYHALYGLQFYAEHAYHTEIDITRVKERTLFCTGMDPEALLALNKMDQPPGVDEGNTLQTNPSKFLLWQDVLLGLFDKHVEKIVLGISIRSWRRKSNSITSRRQIAFLMCRRSCVGS